MEEFILRARSDARTCMRSIKWRCGGLFTQSSLSRVLYPLIQLFVWQRVWIVNGTIRSQWVGGETSCEKWFFARSPDDAARYWGDAVASQGDNPDEGRPVSVRRPLWGRQRLFRVEYAGQNEYAATPWAHMGDA